MKLKELRTLVPNQELVRVLITAEDGNDGHQKTVSAGDNLFFTVDSSIDELNLTSLKAAGPALGKSTSLQDDVNKAVLEIGLSCSMQEMENTNWNSVFNNPVMIEDGDFSQETIGMN